MTTGSSIAGDIKAGLKAIRGGTLEATDELLDRNPDHPEAQASKLQNRSIMEKGKQDLRNADGIIGQHHGVAAAQQQQQQQQSASTSRASQGTAAPAATGRAGEQYTSASNIGA